jgi:hypothetical protein
MTQTDNDQKELALMENETTEQDMPTIFTI